MLKNVVSHTYQKNKKGLGGKHLYVLECGHTTENLGFQGLHTKKHCLICKENAPKSAANYHFKKIGNLKRARICPLLILIGVPPQEIYAKENGKTRTGTFWKRNAHQLSFLLHDFRHYYIGTLKKAHPDTNKEPCREASEIIAAWQRIKVLFKQRGITLD